MVIDGAEVILSSLPRMYSGRNVEAAGSNGLSRCILDGVTLRCCAGHMPEGALLLCVSALPRVSLVLVLILPRYMVLTSLRLVVLKASSISQAWKDKLNGLGFMGHSRGSNL